jgi:hypothetical protein
VNDYSLQAVRNGVIVVDRKTKRDASIYSITGVTTRSYVCGIGIDDLLVRLEGANKIYYLSNQLGSTMALTNSDGLHVWS